MRSLSVGEKNEPFFIRAWKPLPSRHVLKALRRSPEGKTKKDNICYKLGPLQMVSDPYTGRCASEEAKPQRGWTQDSVPTKTLGSKGVDWGRGLTSIGEGNK